MLDKERKRHVLIRIQRSNNELLIREVEKLLNTIEEDDSMQQLTEEQKEAIDRAFDQIENDQVLSDEEVEKELDQWFEK